MTNAPSLFLRGTAWINGEAVFRDVDLHVAAGEWTCLLGASGVGKSTILKLFAGLGDAVDLQGEIGASDGALLAGRVALMAQDDLLLPWLTVLENVLLGARLRGEAPDRSRADDVLAGVGLSEKHHRKPSELSGGQRQRVALARTLMEDRPVVLLDEPFSALDARTRAMMQELAAEVLQGRTVLLVTHDPAEAARLGNRITLMSANDLKEITPPPGPIPRPFDAPTVLACQTGLLGQLREGV